MMEPSSNLNLDLLHHHHHHHQHEDFHGSSSAPAPPFHFASTSSTRTHEYWNQPLLLNSGDDQFTPADNGVHSTSPRDFMIRPSHDVPMLPDLGMFQWPAATDQQGYNTMMNQSQEQQLVSRGVKEELAGVDQLQDYRLLMPPPPSRPAVGDLLGFDPVGSLGGFGPRGSFVGTVLPAANISAGSDQLPAPYSDPLGMDVHALDLLASARFRRTLCAQPTMDDMALLREDLAYGLGQLQPPAAQHASLCQNKISPAPVRANGDGLEYKATQSVAKKPRLESRGASFTPFKVRKEKLGDRIAALQQLVAPFGKTDTASVLMEAIGYIKFLQDQVETLSVPYMRSSNNKKMRTSEETSTGEREEPKLDLRSRGLCLVPLSCTSYVTNENEGVWSPPNYRGGT